jgi:hypothetical protein
MNFKNFLTNEKIPYLPFYYFLQTKEDGSVQKKPIKEKNNLTIDEITTEMKLRAKMTKPKSYWIKEKDNYKEVPLTKEESKSLVLSYTIFLKHNVEYYCIDIDDKNIKSMDDYIEKLESNNIDGSIIDILKSCCWTKGNTKGIHIYMKVINVPVYKNQQDVFNFIDGDFIKTNNMWEGCDKVIENYTENKEPIDFNNIKPLFKSDQLNPKPKVEEKPKEQPKEKPKKTEKEKPKIASNDNEIMDYFNVMLDNNVFEKFNGYKNWLDIGIVLKNTYADDGFNMFNQISKQMPKYDGEEETQRFYNDLNKKIFTNDKKLTIGTIKKNFKDKDDELYKLVNSNFTNLKKGINDKIDFDENKISNFSTEYFNNIQKYAHKKQYFEIFVCKVMRPQPLFIYSENDKDNFNCLLYSESDIISAFKHLGSGIFQTDKKTGEVKESKFITEWLGDKYCKIYNMMDFDPYNGIRSIIDDNKRDCYNLFNGYNKHIYTEFDKNIKEQILKPFKDLLFELVGGCEKQYFDYFYNFLAHLIQKPTERISTCFIFKSKQGVGKNVMLDVIGDIIGKAHYITSSNPKDFFSDYAEGFYRKLLVNINECEGKDTFDYEGKIKSFITEKSITLNPKFVRQTTISNYARLIIFTNKPNPIPIDVRSKDRRFVVFQSSDKYLNDNYGTIFWEKLVQYFQNPKFIACLYDDLNSIKLDGIKWKETRPITKAYLEMCKLYVPVEALFLEDYIDKKLYNDDDDENVDNYDKEIDVNTTDLYSFYTSYCQNYGFINDKTYQPNITKFNGRLQELDLQIIRQKTSTTTVFRFTPKKVYKIMEKRKWIINKENEIEIDEDELKNIGGDNFDDYFIEL